MPEHKTEGKGSLSILFPEKEVALDDGTIIKITPLSLKDMPKVMDAFGIIMKYAEQKVPASELTMVGLTELMKIIPYCIDRSADEVPAGALPEILEIVIEQNLSGEVLGKWMALVQKAEKVQIPGLKVANQSRKKASKR